MLIELEDKTLTLTPLIDKYLFNAAKDLIEKFFKNTCTGSVSVDDTYGKRTLTLVYIDGDLYRFNYSYYDLVALHPDDPLMLPHRFERRISFRYSEQFKIIP